MLVIFAVALLLSMPWLNSVAFMPYWVVLGSLQSSTAMSRRMVFSSKKTNGHLQTVTKILHNRQEIFQGIFKINNSRRRQTCSKNN